MTEDQIRQTHEFLKQRVKLFGPRGFEPLTLGFVVTLNPLIHKSLSGLPRAITRKVLDDVWTSRCEGIGCPNEFDGMRRKARNTRQLRPGRVPRGKFRVIRYLFCLPFEIHAPSENDGPEEHDHNAQPKRRTRPKLSFAESSSSHSVSVSGHGLFS